MDTTADRNRAMVELIRRRGVTDERVLNAMQTVPRHLFVPETAQRQAYSDFPLPIGHGQTISQPYIVALMTELLQLEEGDKVLEIGLGSGYQAAILAQIPGVEVYTMEIIPDIATKAEERLRLLGYENVHCRQGDGYYGWPEEAPFNAIIVTAAPGEVPSPLIAQLATGGRMVIPVGFAIGNQTLWRLIKNPDGTVTRSNEGGVAFVPFTGTGVRAQ